MNDIDNYNLSRFANPGGPGINYDIPTNGLFQVYWSNGNIRYEWYYKDGKRADGISKGWHPNGQLKQIITWNHGKKDGQFIEWKEENGQKEREGTFKNGIENGLWTYYNDDGSKYYVNPNPGKKVKITFDTK